MRRSGLGAPGSGGAARAEATACVLSSGSSSSRISAQMRIRSARAACASRWQNAMRMPGVTCCAMATPRRAGSSPMMWRTVTSAPKLPVRPTASLPGSVRPTSVARSRAIASCGCSSEMPRSRSSTSSAGSPSSSVSTWPSQAVMMRCGATGWQPCVTRETRDTSSPKATPDRPPRNTPPAAPWPLMLPLPPTANCTASLRLATSPPNR
jgi:hypothetical protein